MMHIKLCARPQNSAQFDTGEVDRDNWDTESPTYVPVRRCLLRPDTTVSAFSEPGNAPLRGFSEAAHDFGQTPIAPDQRVSKLTTTLDTAATARPTEPNLQNGRFPWVSSHLIPVKPKKSRPTRTLNPCVT